MKKKKSNSPASTLVAAMKRTKAHCEAIAADPQNHPEIERKAASMVAGQLRHWIFDASDAPDIEAGKAVSSDMAKHRLDGLKVNATRKIEELIEVMAVMELQLVSRALLIDDIAQHMKQLKLPAELKARLLASARPSVTAEQKVA
jgi:hypothetical protein